MRNSFWAKIVYLSKIFEIVIKVISGVFIYVVSVLGVFKFTNVNYEVPFSQNTIKIVILVFSIGIILYIFSYLSTRELNIRWGVIIKAIEDQINNQITKFPSIIEAPIINYYPRDPRVIFTLARLMLSEITEKPILTIKLDLFSATDFEVKKIFKGTTSFVYGLSWDV